MKCKQQLCQRSKNINENGNCNICDDAINEAIRKIEKTDKSTGNVAIDLNMMIEIHKKLSNGVTVEPKVVSGLLLGGVINIINQHDKIVDLENKIKISLIESCTNKTRLEMLENWVKKQDDLINEIDDKLGALDKNGVVLKDNRKIETIQKKLSSLEADLHLSKSVLSKNVKTKDIAPVQTSAKCNECAKTFQRTCDLERHLESHVKAKEFSCDDCGKEFHLKWRLNKHMLVHTDQTQFCHFYNNGKLCPFDEIGCMFRHEDADQCRTRTCTRKWF